MCNNPYNIMMIRIDDNDICRILLMDIYIGNIQYVYSYKVNNTIIIILSISHIKNINVNKT